MIIETLVILAVGILLVIMDFALGYLVGNIKAKNSKERK